MGKLYCRISGRRWVGKVGPWSGPSTDKIVGGSLVSESSKRKFSGWPTANPDRGHDPVPAPVSGSTIFVAVAVRSSGSGLRLWPDPSGK
jgi:hypothetical protein